MREVGGGGGSDFSPPTHGLKTCTLNRWFVASASRRESASACSAQPASAQACGAQFGGGGRSLSVPSVKWSVTKAASSVVIFARVYIVRRASRRVSAGVSRRLFALEGHQSVARSDFVLFVADAMFAHTSRELERRSLWTSFLLSTVAGALARLQFEFARR